MGYATGQPVLWPLRPNWANPVNESLAFLSDVMRSSDTGAEQARALRDTPRRSFSFQSLVGGDTHRITDAIRFDIGVKQFLLPIFPDIQLLGADVATGADEIACRTAGFDFVEGGQALLWTDFNQWELVTIDTIAADHLALDGVTTNAWPMGTYLYPVRKARLQDVPKASYLNGEISKVDCTALIDEACDWPAAWPTATTYRGLPVLEWRNDEGEDPTAQYDRLGDTIDYDVGPVYYLDLPGMPFRNASQRFALRDRAAHSAYRSLLYALDGQTGELWVPTWLADVRMTQPLASNGTQITVPWMGYTQFGYQQQGRRDIAIELTDGTRFYRRITGSADAGDHEVLQMDSDLGVAVDPGAVRQIGWLTPSASSADSFQIQHVTDADGWALSAITWKAVRDDV